MARRKARELRARYRATARSSVSASARRLVSAVEKASTEKKRVVLKRRGKTVAAVVPAEDLTALERLDDLADAEAYRIALAEWERDGKRTVPLESLLEKLGLRP